MSDLSELWRAEMMSIEDIAEFWRLPPTKKGYAYARDVLVKQEGFPEPAPGSTRKFQRWLKSEVLRFAVGENSDAN